MKSLRQRLAEHGFVANEEYDHAVRCLLGARHDHLRCLNVEGTQGGRRTAFAHALGQALGYAHILYHEFTPPPPEEPVRLVPAQEAEEAVGEPPVAPLDRVMAEACALSEGDPTLLILDALHRAPFREHLRLAEFLGNGLWRYGEISLKAHRRHLMVCLLSDDPLYHTLGRRCFRIWVDPDPAQAVRPAPADLDLPETAAPMLEALASLFSELKVNPTLEEYRRLLDDLQRNVHSLEDLRLSIYGWVEGVDREQLMSAPMRRFLEGKLPDLGIPPAQPPPGDR
ncbi:hypothetical protein [Ectothiorhodospira mobilis]|uniref:hypothetical protein n=1 Tax=Ectothiorhodospira mobilis TaxID=195064 RepID=UPI001EE912B5|nr:hypothetical protein [Ectothiorhodospira mobilis]MCG5536681.1 hypothetical protein [Ectothiorhodospira mobilis]